MADKQDDIIILTVCFTKEKKNLSLQSSARKGSSVQREFRLFSNGDTAPDVSSQNEYVR
jgi:hypothetical protein